MPDRESTGGPRATYRPDVAVERVPVREAPRGTGPAAGVAAPRASGVRVPLLLLVLLLPLGFLVSRAWRATVHAGAPVPGARTGAIAGRPAITTRTAGGEVAPAAGAVARFAAWTSARRDEPTPADAARTADGIDLMAEALGETADTDGIAGSAGERAHVSAIRAHAADLRRGADDRARLSAIRAAFTDAAVLIAELQGGSAAANTELMSAAAVRIDRPLQAQARAVRAFFVRAAAALQALSPGSAEPAALGDRR